MTAPPFLQSVPLFLSQSAPLWWCLGGIFAVAILLILIRKKRSCQFSEPELLEDLGFDYDSSQHLFTSTRDAWQRQFGYCCLYDEAAAPLGMLLDCEPIQFTYGGRRWLVELWKGQYGLFTGAEIGVYSSSGPDLSIPGLFDGTFYEQAEELELSMRLYRNGIPLFARQQTHWWLTGFLPGEYSPPGNLSMRAHIHCRDTHMAASLFQGLVALGYGKDEARISGSSVFIHYAAPHSPGPHTRTAAMEAKLARRSRWLCSRFQQLTNGLEHGPAQLCSLRRRAPGLYLSAVRSCRASAALYRHHQSILPHLSQPQED